MSFFDDKNRMVTISRDDRAATDLLNLSLGIQGRDSSFAS